MKTILCIGNDFSGNDELKIEVTKEELDIMQSLKIFDVNGNVYEFAGGWYDITTKTVFISCNHFDVSEVA